MTTLAAEDRVRAVDWLRGFAVLLMIQCHALVLLAPDARKSPWLGWLHRVDGLSTLTFFFAAGFALALLQVRAARSRQQWPRFRRQFGRALEVLAAATLVNVMWFPVLREPAWLLRLDILHSIGLCLLVGLVTLTPFAGRPRLMQAVALVLALMVLAFAPSAARVTGPAARFLNKTTGSAFPLMPWVAFVWLGAFLGGITAEQGMRGFRRGLFGLGGLGGALWGLFKPLSALAPSLFAQTKLVSDIAQRWTWLCGALLVLSFLERFAASSRPPSAFRRVLEYFGTSSLSAYVFHEALLFYQVGGVSFEALWGKRCGWLGYWALTLLLMAMTYGACRLFDRGMQAARHVWQRRTAALA